MVKYIKSGKENEYGEKQYEVAIGNGTMYPYTETVWAYNEQEAVDKVVDHLDEMESELVADFCLYNEKKYPLSKLAATYFATGIITDSGRFQFESANKVTFNTFATRCAVNAKNTDRFCILGDKELITLSI